MQLQQKEQKKDEKYIGREEIHVHCREEISLNPIAVTNFKNKNVLLSLFHFFFLKLGFVSEK